MDEWTLIKYLLFAIALELGAGNTKVKETPSSSVETYNLIAPWPFSKLLYSVLHHCYLCVHLIFLEIYRA